MKNEPSAHRARRVLIGRTVRTDATTKLAACTLSLAALVAGCGAPQRDVQSTYVGSDRIKAVVASYTPPGDTGMMMVGDTAVAMPGEPARATLVAKGVGAVEVILPDGCQRLPIEARIGRMIELRRDRFRTGPGRETTEIPVAEMVDALCGGFEGRDVANPEGREKSRETQ